jgi:hypothetical protein
MPVCQVEQEKHKPWGNAMKKNTGLLISLLLMMPLAASAADVQVRIFERGGKAPLPGVAVCLGTSAKLGQFGASLTDSNGYVVFKEVPRAPLLVTASRKGYKAEQEPLVISTTNRMLVMSLSYGGGGQKCPLDTNASVIKSGGLEVSRFVINKGRASTTEGKVTLDNTIDGKPTQYRASERADFYGADWQPYSTSPAFQLSADKGSKVVYFQVRRHATVNGAVLESLSPVARGSVTLK